MLDDIRFVIRGSRLDEAESIIMSSRRHYRILEIYRGNEKFEGHPLKCKIQWKKLAQEIWLRTIDFRAIHRA